MIDKQYGKYVLVCDICGDAASEDFETFQGAVEYKKENNWKSKKQGSEWLDICPDCQT